MTNDPSSVTNAPAAPKRKITRALGARLVLAACSLLVAALVLEGMTRLLVPPPTPVRLRDQIYVNQLAMVTGRDTVHLVRGAPLPEKKRPGEVRIFVFGESSIQGAPFEYYGSPPTMLYDQLKARFPGKDLTVVNMGRGASAMRDAYYFLATIGRFSPDYIVFYQGNNDMFSGDYEVCLPANHPRLHRAWRWLVEHSRLAWMIRAQGPVFWVRHMKRDWATHAEASLDRTQRCEPGKGFQAWTNLLVETAKEMGAQVYVTTPVTSPLVWAEEGGAQWGAERAFDVAGRRGAYRRLLTCLLSDDCDLVATWRQEQGQAMTDNHAPTAQGLFARVISKILNVHEEERGKEQNLGDVYEYLKQVQRSSDRITTRGDAWVRTANRHRAHVIDFFAYLKNHEDQGLRRPIIFVEDVHLSLRGYWTLAWQWANALAPQFGGAPTMEPPELDARYLPAVVRDLRQGPACILLHVADVYLRAGDPLLVANLVEQAAAYERASPERLATSRAGLMSQLLVGWMRRQLGLDPRLPAPLAAQLGHVDLARLHQELSDGSEYCRSVGGDWLTPLVSARDDSALPEPRGDEPSMRAGSEDVSYVITPEGAQQIGAMLGMDEHVKPGGCALDDVQIERDLARATYLCPGGGKAVIELRHASTKLHPVARTERFVLLAGTPPPSETLVRDLVKSVRDGESGFRWQETLPNAPPQGDEAGRPAEASPQASRRVLPGLLVLGVLLGTGGIFFLRRRRRRAKRPLP